MKELTVFKCLLKPHSEPFYPLMSSHLSPEGDTSVPLSGPHLGGGATRWAKHPTPADTSTAGRQVETRGRGLRRARRRRGQGPGDRASHPWSPVPLAAAGAGSFPRPILQPGVQRPGRVGEPGRGSGAGERGVWGASPAGTLRPAGAAPGHRAPSPEGAAACSPEPSPGAAGRDR